MMSLVARAADDFPLARSRYRPGRMWAGRLPLGAVEISPLPFRRVPAPVNTAPQLARPPRRGEAVAWPRARGLEAPTPWPSRVAGVKAGSRP